MKIHTLLFALIAALAFAFVACGDDDNAASNTATATHTTPATSTAAATATASVATTATPSPPATVFDCGTAHKGTTPDASAFPVTVTDGTGVSVTLTAPPEHVASLDAAHTEVLFAIGAGDQVSAVDNYSDCPTSAAALPKIDSFNISLEAITAQNPDLVVLGFTVSTDIAMALQGAGIKVLTQPSPSDINGVYDNIELLGEVTGHAGEADNLVTSMSNEVHAITAEVAGKTAPSVYHEVDNTYYSVGPGSFIDDLYKTLGARNIAMASGEAYPQLSAEAIIAANPDVIILADEDAGESESTVAARPGWSVIGAVKNHRVNAIDPNIVSRPGPRIVDALRLLKLALYG
ncbi:MAG: ABC transporter substrate-binding protein [Chloroflexota bacterium]